jgi:WD40 repeat protein
MKPDDRLIDLLLADEDARESGTPKTPEEICVDCPELLPEFRKKLAKLHAANAAAERVEVSTGMGGRTAPYDKALPANLDSARYRPLEFLAKGGQGTVFTAEDGEVGRTVALKCLHARGADNPGVRSRFLFEAEVTGRLEHPGIVPVYGLGRDRAGRPYYVMRLIGGATLHDKITAYHNGDKVGTERSVEFRDLLQAFTAVCKTLAYAHVRGVIHRDLKPHNIMIGGYGETLVVDWGLAKRVNAPEPEEGAAPGPEPLKLRDAGTLSFTGYAKGTWAYMPPEQARGEWARVGPASDVFGLGATLYAILTGHAPYEGVDAMERARAARYSPPRALNSEVPRALEAVCLKAMAPRPEDRYAGAQELARDVERFLADEPVSAWREPLSVRTRRWAKRHRLALVAGAAAVGIGIASLIAVLADRARDIAEGARGQAEIARNDANEQRQVADTQRGLAVEKSQEADRQRQEADKQRGVAVEKGQEADKQRGIAVEALGEARKAQEALAVLNYARTIDLAHREYLANNIPLARKYLAACREDLRGWEWHHVNRLCNPDLFKVPGAAWVAEFSPDGKRLATVDHEGAVTVWDGMTGARVAELKPPRSDHTQGVWFTPGGERIVALARRADGRHIWVGDARTGAIIADYTPMIPKEKPEGFIAAAPRGNRILVGGADGRTNLIETATSKIAFTFPKDEVVRDAWFSRDGMRLAADVGKELQIRDAGTGEIIGALDGNFAFATDVWFSDDGRSIAARIGESVRLASGKTWTPSALLSTNLKRRTKQPDVRVSPDAKRIAIGSKGGIPVVFWKPGDPVGPRDKKDSNDVPWEFAAVWSADQADRPILSSDVDHPIWDVTSDVSRAVTGGTGGVEVLDLRDGKNVIRKLTLAGKVLSARFNPDGSRLVTQTQVIQRAGERAAVLQVWDVSNGRELVAVPVYVPLESNAPVRPNTFVMRVPDDNQLVNLTPDGKRIVISAAAGTVEVRDMETGALVVARKGPPITGNRARAHVFGLNPAVMLDTDATAPPDRLVVSPDGNRLVTMFKGEGAVVWDVRSAAESRAFAKPPGASGFGEPPFHPNDTRVALVRLPNGQTGRRIVTMGSTAVTIIDTWSTDPPRVLRPDPRLKFWEAAISPDGSRVVTWEAWRPGQFVRFWDAASGELLASDDRDFFVAPLFTGFTPDGKSVLAVFAGVWFGTLETDQEYPPSRLVSWDVKTGKRSDVMPVPGCRDRGNVALARDGDRLVMALSGRKFGPPVLVDVATGKEIRELASPPPPGAAKTWRNGPSELVASSDGKWLAGVVDGQGVIWDVATGKELHRVGEKGTMTAIRLSPDRKFAVSVSYSNPPRIWEIASGRVVAELIGHSGSVNWAEFSPDGTRITTASDDGTVRVWEARTGYSLLTLAGHPDPVGRASFSPDGAVLISSSKLESRVWGAALLAPPGLAKD